MSGVPASTGTRAGLRIGSIGTYPWKIVAVVAAIAMVAAYFGARWLFHDRFFVTTDDATVDVQQVLVMSRVSERVVTVKADVNQYVHRGQTLIVLDSSNEEAKLDLAKANYEASVSSLLEAKRTFMVERETQEAQMGGSAAMLQQAQAQVLRANVDTEYAVDGVAKARAVVAAAKARVESADAGVEIAQANFRKAERAFLRTEPEFKLGYISEDMMDSRSTDVEVSRSGVVNALAEAHQARADLETAVASLSQQTASAKDAALAARQSGAQSIAAQNALLEKAAPVRAPYEDAPVVTLQDDVAAALAQVRLAHIDLESTRIVAPIDGWVASRDVQVGQTTSNGQSLMTISPDATFVTANYQETQVGRIRIGSSAVITVDGCGGQRYSGRVLGVYPATQGALSSMPSLEAPSNFVKITQRVPVRISLPKSTDDCIFRPGMSVEASVSTRRS